MSKDHRRAWMAWSVAAAIALISVTGVVVSRAESPPGCDVGAPGSIVESAHFTPVEGTLTEPPDPPITMVGQPDMAVPADASVESIDGLPRRWAVISENGAAYQYFSRPNSRSASLSRSFTQQAEYSSTETRLITVRVSRSMY
jgi:hypothetical protein